MRPSLVPILCSFVSVASATAQSAVFRGRVLTDSAERPIPGVEITIVGPDLKAVSDSSGQFRISGIRPGTYAVMARKMGFGPLTARLRFAAGDSLDADLLLSPTAQTLPNVTVQTNPAPPPKLKEFEERRLEGHGRFLTQADIEKYQGSVTSDILRRLPGIELIRDARSSAYYVAAGRLSQPGCALCGGGNRPPSCFAAIVIDGAYVYTGGEPRYNVNLIDPSSIAGIEYYAGAASIPVKYNGTRETCGLLVIWTK